MAKKKFGSLFLLLGGITIAGGLAVLATLKSTAAPNTKRTSKDDSPRSTRYVDRRRRPRSEWMLEAVYNGVLYQLDPPESVVEGTPLEARTLRGGDRLVGYLDGQQWVFTKRGYEGAAWFEFPNTDQLVGLTNLGPPIGARKESPPKPDPGNPQIQCIKAPCELPGPQGNRDGQS